jgi:transposase InsO family protein
VLQVGERRVNRWQGRRVAETLADRPAGGGAVHGLLAEEVEAILELAEQWGEIDRSHRKLAHRGSYTGRVWVSPASVDRVLAAHDLVLPTPPSRAPVQRQPWPDWLEDRPNRVWGWDVTHFGRCRAAPCAFAIIDLVSRKWLATLLSAEETSTQVQIVFTDALQAEGLLELVAARQDGRVDLAVDDLSRPLLLAVSDNGPQMTSGSTREFLALCSIVQHFGRPHTPTDQAPIESFFGHVKGEWPHCDDPCGGRGAGLTLGPTGLLPASGPVGPGRGHRPGHHQPGDRDLIGACCTQTRRSAVRPPDRQVPSAPAGRETACPPSRSPRPRASPSAWTPTATCTSRPRATSSAGRLAPPWCPPPWPATSTCSAGPASSASRSRSGSRGPAPTVLG